MNIEKLILRRTTEAIKKHSLLEKDEKVIYALSGGKDSKSLLKILTKIHPVENIFPMHVFPYFSPELSKNIHGYCDRLLNRSDSLIEVENPDWKNNPEDCYMCARSRKKLLFETAQAQGINKIVYAHNKNDVAETFLLNIIYSGNTYTMFPKQSFFDGKFEVIRPFYNVEVKDIIRYCRIYQINPQSYTCKGKAINKRARIREILDGLEKDHNEKSNSIIHRVFVASSKANEITN